MRPDLLPITFRDCLSHVVEECGEVLKAIGKLDRFGEKATDPKTGIKYDNIADLLTEINDLENAMNRVKQRYQMKIPKDDPIIVMFVADTDKYGTVRIAEWP